MKLSRSSALILAKVLFHHAELEAKAVAERRQEHVTPVEGLDEIRAELDAFLESGSDEVTEEVECCDDEYRSHGDDEEEEEEDESDAVGENISVDDEIKADVLHRLTLQRAVPLTTSLLADLDGHRNVELSFEATFDDDGVVECVDLLIGEGEHIIADIDVISRTGTEIQVHERGVGWHVFSVAKFNKDWTKGIPVNKVLEIVE